MGQREILVTTLWKMLSDVSGKSFFPFSVNRDQSIGTFFLERGPSNAQSWSSFVPGGPNFTWETKEERWNRNIRLSQTLQTSVTKHSQSFTPPTFDHLEAFVPFSQSTVILCGLKAMQIDGRGKSNRRRWEFQGGMWIIHRCPDIGRNALVQWEFNFL